MPASAQGASDGAGDAATVVNLDWRSAAWIAGGIVTGLVLLAFVRSVPDSVTRVGVGILLAFALDPVVVRLRHRFGVSRPVAVAAVGLSAVALFAVLIFVLGPPAVRQAQRFSAELPETVEQLYGVPILGSRLEDAEAADKVREWAADLPARLDTATVTATARSVLDGVLAGLIVIVVGVAVLVDGDRMVGRISAALPSRFEARALTVGRTFYRTIGAYFSGSVLVAILAATFNLAVGLAFGVPLAPAAALWTLMVNLIPQVGGFLSGSFLTVLALTQGVETGLAVLALYLVYMNLENHVIQPAIVGRAVDLSPPATMLAALVGAAAAGVPGALVATPLVGAAKSLYLELRWGVQPEVERAESPWRKLLRRLRGALGPR
ncbi:MAG: AI-2E family transporter [Acidimicrobiia bacterium]